MMVRFSRRALLLTSAIGLSHAFSGYATRRAWADQSPAAMKAAAKAAKEFMKALRKNDVETALVFAAAPFVAEDVRILPSKVEVQAYLTEMLANIDPAELPNAVLSVLDYEESRAATAEPVLKLRDTVLGQGDMLVAIGREGVSHGVLLVSNKGENPLIAGVGY